MAGTGGEVDEPGVDDDPVGVVDPDGTLVGGGEVRLASIEMSSPTSSRVT